MSPNEVIDAVKLEIAELKKLGAVSDRQYAAALRYISNNGDELIETAEYASISELVDVVTSVCGIGGCE